MTDGRGYTDADADAVLDSPEWTEKDFAQAKQGRDVLPREFLAKRGLEAAGVVGKNGCAPGVRLRKTTKEG